MNGKDFGDVVDAQLKRCQDVLNIKAGEYATTDRLHNFKVAAELEGVSNRQALSGMMAKHTVSIYDMCRSDSAFVLEIWDEKITDHMNYLLLLAAIVQEESGREVPRNA